MQSKHNKIACLTENSQTAAPELKLTLPRCKSNPTALRQEATVAHSHPPRIGLNIFLKILRRESLGLGQFGHNWRGRPQLVLFLHLWFEYTDDALTRSRRPQPRDMLLLCLNLHHVNRYFARRVDAVTSGVAQRQTLLDHTKQQGVIISIFPSQTSFFEKSC